MNDEQLSGTYSHVNNRSAPELKIALFRSLFRGRDDVYPQRFESKKTGKSGYAPACANEWVRGLCDKRSTKCSVCPHRQFLPVTVDVVRQHLQGEDRRQRDFVIGVYPMLLDETCFFLAADFDKSTWIDDVAAFRETCRNLQLPVLLERSRSGNGGHAWLFFDEAVPANLARRLGAHLLTETMERRPDVGLDSYDRFFPNQDTLPRGGLGNLIALPLQKRSRENSNTIFLDGEFNPHEDQWSVLATVEKINRSAIEEIVHDAERKGRIVGVRMSLPDDDQDDEPWAAAPSRRRKEPRIKGPLPKQLELTLGDQIYVPKEGLPPGLRNRLVRLAAFQNPEFYKAQAMRLPTYDKPRIIACAEDCAKHIGLPRGCLDDLNQCLHDLKIKPVINDQRFSGLPLDVTFQGQLRPKQQEAFDALLAEETGVLSATTAFGKTVVAASLIAARGVNTLVLVHRRSLLEQWIERLATFLDIPKKSIGQIGAGRKNPGGLLDVGIIQSLVRKGTVDDQVGEYGHLVVDECHHLSARSFELVARRAKAPYVTGLSATVARKDGHHPIIFMQCGPVRYQVDAKSQADSRPFIHTVHVRPTGFHSVPASDDEPRAMFQSLCNELIHDDARNRMICDDVKTIVAEGRFPLLLTQRTEHLDHLAEMLSPHVPQLVVLKGGLGNKQRKAAMDRLASLDESKPRLLLATGHYIGEGFDDPRLDTLMLTMPVSWRGTIAQYAGRLHRLHDSKLEVRVYDYADLNVQMLSKMFDRRCRGYEAIGYQVFLPASAVAGWPNDVPLPVDASWKERHAASVQRLIRDGVDAPLADLFVRAVESAENGSASAIAAANIVPNAFGVERARSASEAFFFRRLETLPETSGRFRLNEELPIPFDQRGKMEVDFLCAEAKLVIELDGDQHLSDPEAYRRDRRKDALLQENGYFVLRFLARDIGLQLVNILDTISRTLAHQGNLLD